MKEIKNSGSYQAQTGANLRAFRAVVQRNIFSKYLKSESNWFKNRRSIINIFDILLWKLRVYFSDLVICLRFSRIAQDQLHMSWSQANKSQDRSQNQARRILGSDSLLLMFTERIMHTSAFSLQRVNLPGEKNGLFANISVHFYFL